MTYDKYITLVMKLNEKAKQGGLDWEVTANGGFQTAVSNVVLRISEEYSYEGDPEASPDYMLSLYNETGNLIETITDTELRRHNSKFEAFRIMREIFKIARRTALGADEAVDSVIQGLDDIIPL